MLRFAAAALAALIFTAAALAQLPAPLEQALSNAPGGAAPERIALRMTVNDQSILVEMTPAADGEPGAHRLLQPADETVLTEEQAEMWAGLRGDDDPEEDADAGARYSVSAFDPEALREAIGGAVTLEGDDAGRLVYRFQPQALPGQGGEGRGREALLANLRGEISVDAARSEIASVRFELVRSFKPNLAARLDSFLLEQRYVHEPAIDGPRFSGMTMAMSGSAVFQPFNQTLSIELVSVRYALEPAPDDVLEAAPESP
jgi:hypothetical protein